MPAAWVPLVLADRWHIPPWDLEQAPIDRYHAYLDLLGVEARVAEATEGWDGRDGLTWDHDDYFDD